MKNIVLIADVVANHDNIDLKNNDLECISKSYFNNLFDGLTKAADKVTHYISPIEFMNNIYIHKDDIVLSVWSGHLSRNRKSLVPSICEAYNISYVGADPYVSCICQDKTLSKYIAAKFDIKGAKDLLITDQCKPEHLFNLRLPVVVKPNFEGGSNGISNKNIVFTYEEATDLCNKLMKYFNQPILIEEYIDGTEVCVTIAGKRGIIDVLEADAIVMEDNKERYPMFGYEAKKSKIIKYRHEPATHLLTNKMKTSFINLFNSLGKIDVLRIDGKINKGRFTLLEITPDPNYDMSASIAYDFKLAGYDYENMLRKILSYADN